jgi:hypothetical protein
MIIVISFPAVRAYNECKSITNRQLFQHEEEEGHGDEISFCTTAQTAREILNT